MPTDCTGSRQVIEMYSRSPEGDGSTIKHSMISLRKKTVRSTPAKKVQAKGKGKGKSRELVPLMPPSRDKRLMKAPVSQNVSSSQSGRDRDRYVESERIGTVTGTVDFLVGIISQMNPGLAGSFPWLSGHANLYEKYRVNKLIYRYKNLKGTATDGNVLFGFDYDVLDGPPATAIQMTQLTEWIDGAPWRIFEFRVPTDGRILFTRQGPVAGADLKTYDMGQLFVATEGCPAAQVGYLEVEYDISFYNKQSSFYSVPSSYTTSVWTLSGNADAFVDGENPISNWVQVSGNNGVFLDSENRFQVPQGNWLISGQCSIGGSAGASTDYIDLDFVGGPNPRGPSQQVAAGTSGILSGQYHFTNDTNLPAAMITNVFCDSVSGDLVVAGAGSSIVFQTVA